MVEDVGSAVQSVAGNPKTGERKKRRPGRLTRPSVKQK
ncbi:MAG: hypothetical protein O2845_05725 [Proteobacteria bacterium]|nr:hypothetical protein [Pseudomonadota bacterium]